MFSDFWVICLMILGSFWTLGAQGGDPRGPPFGPNVDFGSILGTRAGPLLEAFGAPGTTETTI